MRVWTSLSVFGLGWLVLLLLWGCEKKMNNIFLMNAWQPFSFQHFPCSRTEGQPDHDCWEQWQEYLEWMKDKKIGPPQATARDSVEGLQRKGIVGIYTRSSG